jgi:hypothetical protein
MLRITPTITQLRLTQWNWTTFESIDTSIWFIDNWWTNVAIQREWNEIRFYKNWELFETKTATINSANVWFSSIFNYLLATNENPFDWLIQDFTITPRLLTAQEIKNFHNRTKNLFTDNNPQGSNIWFWIKGWLIVDRIKALNLPTSDSWLQVWELYNDLWTIKIKL